MGVFSVRTDFYSPPNTWHSRVQLDHVLREDKNDARAHQTCPWNKLLYFLPAVSSGISTCVRLLVKDSLTVRLWQSTFSR